MTMPAGTVLMPGVGFDVVPSDSLANLLKQKMPDATHLELAICSDGAGSAGSAKTSLLMFSGKCLVRRRGKLIRKALGWQRKSIAFSDRDVLCMSVSWGDIVTAYHSTGIENITVYMGIDEAVAKKLRLFSPLAPLLRLPFLQRKLFAGIEKKVQGPDAISRAGTVMRQWGQVCNAAGDTLTATLEGQEGFTITTHATLTCVEKVLSSDLAGGYYTPTQAFGTRLLDEIPGLHLRSV